MADQQDYVYRAAGLDDLAKYDNILERLMKSSARGVDVKILDLAFSGGSPSSITELRTGFTDEFDGTTTPADVYIVSDSTSDSATGTGIRTVEVFGIDENNALKTTTVIMAGTTTGVATGTLWKRINQLKGKSWGSTGKAEGFITVGESSLSPSKIYASITTGNNCSINFRSYIPSGYKAFIGSMHVNAKINSTGVLTDIYNTCEVDPVFVNSNESSRAILDERSFAMPVLCNDFDIPVTCLPTITGDNSSYISLRHAIVSTAATILAFYHMSVFMFKLT